MTADLRDRLEDLLTEVPAHVRADPAAALRAGTRRRVRRRAAVALSAVVVGVLAGTVGLAARHTTELPPVSGNDRGAGTGSLPVRLDAPLWSRRMPDAPGRLAGVVQRDGGWSAVSGSGQVWRIFGAGEQWPPALSPDGLQLGYMNVAYGQQTFTIVHLTDGSAVDGAAGGPAPREHSTVVMPPGTVSFWSPDSRRLLVPARNGLQTRPHAVAFVIATQGHSALIHRRPGPRARPVGWLTANEIGWLGPSAPGDRAGSLVLYVTTRRGRTPVRTVDLRTRLAWGDVRTATLGPGGVALEVTTSTRSYEFGSSGLLVGSRALPRGAVVGCPVSWSRSEPWVPTAQGARADAVLVSQASSVLVQADPALHAGCSLWARSALDGTRHRGLGGWLFGDRTGWLSWHWRQVGIGTALVALLAAAGGGVVLRRRRRRLVAGG